MNNKLVFSLIIFSLLLTVAVIAAGGGGGSIVIKKEPEPEPDPIFLEISEEEAANLQCSTLQTIKLLHMLFGFFSFSVKKQF